MTSGFIVTPDDVEDVMIKNGLKPSEDEVMSAYYSLDYDMIEKSSSYIEDNEFDDALDFANAEIEIQLKEKGFLD